MTDKEINEFQKYQETQFLYTLPIGRARSGVERVNFEIARIINIKNKLNMRNVLREPLFPVNIEKLCPRIVKSRNTLGVLRNILK